MLADSDNNFMGGFPCEKNEENGIFYGSVTCHASDDIGVFR